LERCDRLAAFSEEPDRLTRRFATHALREANATVLGWMSAAGMAVHQDAIGNVIGRREAAGDAPATLLMGSHLDTVAGAGRYDGMLGVLVALACVERLRDWGRALPFAVEVLGFADEEGVRYGTAYLGSGVVAGTFDPAALERRDAEGVSMAAAITAFGGDVAGLAAARDAHARRPPPRRRRARRGVQPPARKGGRDRARPRPDVRMDGGAGDPGRRVLARALRRSGRGGGGGGLPRHAPAERRRPRRR